MMSSPPACTVGMTATAVVLPIICAAEAPSALLQDRTRHQALGRISTATMTL